MSEHMHQSRGPQPAAPQAAPGWYPVDGATQRYWDGYEWTNNIAPLTAGQQLMHGVTKNDETYATIMHLGGFFVSFIVPLIMWLLKKDESQFIDFHGRQALNLQLSMLIYGIVSFILLFVLIGIILLPIVFILDVIFSIVAAIKAYNGEYYRIPVAIQFF